jgi:aerobic carbon-monoxide dehydrogenase medium subunit
VSSFELRAPATVDEAIAELRVADGERVAVLAGGTDLLLDIDDGRAAPRRVISLRRLPWKTLDWFEGSLTIGSTLPLSALEEDPDLARRLPGLWQAVHAVGSLALRHRATLGGNLGRSAPASDLLPVLLALEAEVELVGPEGTRSLPIDRFVRASRQTTLRPAELIRSVRIPESRASAYLWQRVRPANDISQIAVAAAFSPSARRWTLSAGGMPPRPVLLPEVAELLGSGPAAEPRIGEAARLARERVVLRTDQRASEEYRRRLVGTLLARAVRTVSAQIGGAS